ncbi:toxin VasX [Pseudoalteromonas sp. 31A1]|uniref:toxin VasX n=1 Tax=Pseudoalteromonas sp. 31A1 TaxID=2686351 RepID=UPI0013FE4959|nr:toxin VasX [Pseudoalteromonas sp. 31A1]
MSDLNVADKIDEKNAHRELVFERQSDGVKNVSLMVRDESVNRSSKGYYKIPLYQVDAKEESDNTADIELVHIFPIRYAHPADEIDDHKTNLRDGFLYIFVDGHLWRELKVTTNKDVTRFKDINLAWQKGALTWKQNKGFREATGEALKTVIVPYKLNGQVCEVQIAHSEIQWPWKQIQLFGGLKPEDPRLNYGEPVKPGENNADAIEVRNNRLFTLDKLGDFEQGYNSAQLPKHVVLDVTNKAGVYQPIIPDVLGKARQACADIALARSIINTLLLDKAAKGKSVLSVDELTKEQRGELELASFIQQTFFAFPQSVSDKLATYGEDSVSEQEQKIASDYKKWVENKFDKTAFRKFLDTEQVHVLGQYINELRANVKDLIEDEETASCFYQCARDYAYHTGNRRLEIYQLMCDVLAPLKDLTADMLRSSVVYDQDAKKLEQIDSNDLGQYIILKVLGTHPEDTSDRSNLLKLHKLLFPDETNSKPNLTEYKCFRDEEDPKNVDFSIDEFKALEKQDDQLDGYIEGDLTQVFRRSSQAVWGFFNIIMEVPSATYSMSQGGGTIKDVFTARMQKQSSLQRESNEVKQQISNLKEQIKNKQDEIKSSEKTRNELIQEARNQGIDSDDITEQLNRQLKQRNKELEHYKTLLKQAKTKSSVTRAHLSTLKSVGLDMLNSEARIKSVAMSYNPYQKIMHLAHMVSDGLLVEIDIDVNDYYEGNLPDSVVPLNFNSRSKRAEQRILEFNKITEGIDEALSQGSYPGNGGTRPIVKLKINDKVTIPARLDLITSLDGSLNELEAMVTKQYYQADSAKNKVIQKMVVLDKDKLLALKAAEKKLGDTLEAFETAQLKTNWDLTGYKDHNKSLKKYAQTALGKQQKGKVGSASIGVLPFVTGLEVINFYTVITGDGVSLMDKTSAYADLLDVMVNIGKDLVERRYGMPSSEQLKLFSRNKVPASEFTKKILRGRLSVISAKVALSYAANAATFLAGAISTYVAVRDAVNEYNKGNIGLATANSIMALGFLSMTAASGIAIITKGASALIAVFGIAGLVIVLIAAGLIYYFSESEVEAWLHACPWGKAAFVNDGSTSVRAEQWRNRPDLALLDIYNALYKPYAKVIANEHSKTVSMGLTAPVAAVKEGVDTKISWRMLPPDKGMLNYYAASLLTDYDSRLARYTKHKHFSQIPLDSVIFLKSLWTLQPARTGWQAEINNHVLLAALGLESGDQIELKLEATVYPNGKVQPTIQGFNSNYGLPIEYYKAGEKPGLLSFNDDRKYSHRIGQVISQAVINL